MKFKLVALAIDAKISMTSYSMLMNNVFATTAAIITFSKNQNFPSNDVFYFFFCFAQFNSEYSIMVGISNGIMSRKVKVWKGFLLPIYS